MRVSVLILFVLGFVAFDVQAQRPRAVDDTSSKTAPKVAPAPQTVKAKYEGGVFGYNKTMEGTLSFDDTNSRLVQESTKEVFFIPYNAVTSLLPIRRKSVQRQRLCECHSLIYALPANSLRRRSAYLR